MIVMKLLALLVFGTATGFVPGLVANRASAVLLVARLTPARHAGFGAATVRCSPFVVAAICGMLCCTALAGDDESEHIRAAKAAEAEYHTLCDKWQSASKRGEDTTIIEKGINDAHRRFVEHTLKTRYIPNAAMFLPETFAGAGRIVDDTGKKWSYVVGGAKTLMAMWVWERAEWTSERLPPHGFAGVLCIPADEDAGVLQISKAIRIGEGSKTILRVPYTLGKMQGSVEFHFADRSVHPDRGTVDAVGGWHPFAATQPSAGGTRNTIR